MCSAKEFRTGQEATKVFKGTEGTRYAQIFILARFLGTTED